MLISNFVFLFLDVTGVTLQHSQLIIIIVENYTV